MYELAGAGEAATAPINDTPFDQTGSIDESLSGEPGVIPSGSLGWDSPSVYGRSPVDQDEEGGLWNATGIKDDEPLAPSASGDVSDPAIPSFDGFQ